MIVLGVLTVTSLVVASSAEYFDYGRHYDVYKYHGDAYSKYDVNRDGVDDRLDLDRNGKIDKYEKKHRHGYGSEYDKHDYKPSRHYHSNKHEKHDYHKDVNKYHKKDHKDHYATSRSYKKHEPHHRHRPSYKSDPYDGGKKYWSKKSGHSKYEYDDKKHDGYGSYTGVSYGKNKKSYDEDKHHKRSYDVKHSSYDSYDHKKDYDPYPHGYKKDRKYDNHKDHGYHGDKDYGYQPYPRKSHRDNRHRGRDYDPDGKRYEKYDVTDYDIHPDGKYSKTSTKVYKSTSYHKDDKYDRDYKYDRKHDPYDRSPYRNRKDDFRYKPY